MSRPFSSLGPAVLLAVMLAGCATPGGGPVSGDGAEPSGARDSGVSADLARAFERGTAQLREQRYAEAAGTFAAITERNPRLAGPWVNLGIAYAGNDQPELARQALETAVALDSTNVVAHNQLGILHREAGRFDDARFHYEQALAGDPGYGNAHHNLGILCDLYLRDYACAQAHYQAYAQVAGDDDRQAARWLADLERRMRAGDG